MVGLVWMLCWLGFLRNRNGLVGLSYMLVVLLFCLGVGDRKSAKAEG